MSHHCPECERVLYSRRLIHCGYCGATIPDSLRFTAEEIAERDKKMDEIKRRKKERVRVAQEEEAARRRSAKDDGINFSSFM